MKLNDIKRFRQNICDILNEDDSVQHQKLVELAKEVGAGYVHSKIAGTIQTEDAINYTTDNISVAELVLNINNALQTETMINALKTANLSWLVAVIAAVISVVAVICMAC